VDRIGQTQVGALRLEFDDVEERVTEVPAPDTAGGAADVMSMVDVTKR